MAKRQATITAYNKATAQIQNGLTNDAAPVVSNLAAIEIPLDELNPIVKDHEVSFAGIERKNFIQQFDDSLVSTGTNTIIIDGGAVILHEVDNTSGVITERTGWANSGSIDVTGIASGVIWAIYPGLTYSATNNNPANKPANAYRLLTFTNSAGTVTVNKKSWQNSIESHDVILEENLTVNKTSTFKGNVIFDAPPIGLGVGLPSRYHDVQIEYTSASTITVLAGSRVRSSDDTTDIIFSSNTTCVLSTSGAGGLDTGSEASNTTYYLYAIYNTTTLTSALLFSTVNESVSGSITLPSGYTKKRQILTAGDSEVLNVYNNSSSNIDHVGGTEIFLTGGNGYGSTNTYVPRFTTVQREIGNAVTRTDSASDGTKFTINKDGKYFIGRCSQNSSANGHIGLSLNSTALELQASYDSLTASKRMGASYIYEYGTAASFGVLLNLKKGDVLTPHDTYALQGASGLNTWILITREG